MSERTRGRNERERKKRNGRVPRVIRLFYRTISTSLLLLYLLPFFLFSCSPNYSPGYTFSGFHELRFAGRRKRGRERGRGSLSHLESNRGPLSKKLISLNIILGASGSRRALTGPLRPSPRPPTHRRKTLLSQPHASFLHRELGVPPFRPSLIPLQPLCSFSPSPPSPSPSRLLPTLNFLMRKCFQRAGEKYCVYGR